MSTPATEQSAADLAEFTEYFVRNYPGPSTIISDPNWHAPKIFKAAKRAIENHPAPAAAVGGGDYAEIGDHVGPLLDAWQFQTDSDLQYEMREAGIGKRLDALLAYMDDPEMRERAEQCCDTPAYCSSVRRCARQDTPAAPVGGFVDHPSLQVPCRHCGAVGMCPEPLKCLTASNAAAAAPAAQPSAKDGVRGIPMGGQNFVHNEKNILDAINTHEFAKEVVAESFSGLTPRETTTASGLVDDAMVERACKRYAFREDGAVWPDAYSPNEVAAERVLMREFLEHVVGNREAAIGREVGG